VGAVAGLGPDGQGGGALGGEVERAAEVLSGLDGGDRFVGVALSARMALSLYDAHVDWAFGIEDLERDHGRDAVVRLLGVGLAAWLAGTGDAAARAQAWQGDSTGHMVLVWLALVELTLGFSTEDEPVDSGFLAELFDDHGDEALDEFAEVADADACQGAREVVDAWLPLLSGWMDASVGVVNDVADLVRAAAPELEDADQEALAAEVASIPVYGLLAARLVSGGADPRVGQLAKALREARDTLAAAAQRRQRRQAARDVLDVRAADLRASLDDARPVDPAEARAAWAAAVQALPGQLNGARRVAQEAEATLTQARVHLDERTAVLDARPRPAEQADESSLAAAKQASGRASSRRADARLALTITRDALGQLDTDISRKRLLAGSADYGGMPPAYVEARTRWKDLEARLVVVEGQVAERASRYLEILARRDELGARRTELAGRTAPQRPGPRPPSGVDAAKARSAAAAEALEVAQARLATHAAVLGEEATQRAAEDAALEAAADAVREARAARDAARQEHRILDMSVSASRSSHARIGSDMEELRERVEREAEERARVVFQVEVRWHEARKLWQAHREEAVEARASAEAGRGRMAAVRTRGAGLGVRLGETSQSGSALRAEQAELERSRDSLPDRLAAARARIPASGQARQEAVARGARLRAEMGALRVRLGSQRSEVRTVGQQQARATAQLEQARSRHGDLARRVDGARTLLRELEQGLRRRRGERREGIEQALEDARVRHAAVRSALEDARARSELLSEKKADQALHAELITAARAERTAVAEGLETDRSRLGAAALDASCRTRAASAEAVLLGAQRRLEAALTALGPASESQQASQHDLSPLETAHADALAARDALAIDASREACAATRDALASVTAALTKAHGQRADRVSTLQTELVAARASLEAASAARCSAAERREDAGPPPTPGEEDLAYAAALDVLSGEQEALAEARAARAFLELDQARLGLELSEAAVAEADAQAADAQAALAAGRAGVRQAEERVQDADLARAAARRLAAGATRTLTSRRAKPEDTHRALEEVVQELGRQSRLSGAPGTLVPAEDEDVLEKTAPALPVSETSSDPQQLYAPAQAVEVTVEDESEGEGLELTDPGARVPGARVAFMGLGRDITANPTNDSAAAPEALPPEADDQPPTERTPPPPPQVPPSPAKADAPRPPRAPRVSPISKARRVRRKAIASQPLPFLGVGGPPKKTDETDGADGADAPQAEAEALAPPISDAATKILKRPSPRQEGPRIQARKRRTPKAVSKPQTNVSDLLNRIRSTASSDPLGDPDLAPPLTPSPPASPVDLGAATVLLSKEELARRREELLAELESDSPKKPEPDSAAKTRILSREEVLAALDDE